MDETIKNTEAKKFQDIPTDYDAKITQKKDSKVWQDAEQVEFDVFERAGYVKNLNVLRGEYEKYDRETTMVTLYDQTRPIGAIRMIDYDPEIGFKTIDDAQEGELTIDDEGWEIIDTIDPKKVLETGTISLAPEYRYRRTEGLHAVDQLYSILYTYAREKDKEYLVASYDKSYLRRFERIYGDTLVRLGPPKDYMGSETVPVLIDLGAMSSLLQASGYEKTWLDVGSRVILDEDDN